MVNVASRRPPPAHNKLKIFWIAKSKRSRSLARIPANPPRPDVPIVTRSVDRGRGQTVELLVKDFKKLSVRQRVPVISSNCLSVDECISDFTLSVDESDSNFTKLSVRR